MKKASLKVLRSMSLMSVLKRELQRLAQLLEDGERALRMPLPMLLLNVMTIPNQNPFLMKLD